MQSSEAHPTVMLFALIALEKFSQTSKFLFCLLAEDDDDDDKQWLCGISVSGLILFVNIFCPT